MVKYNLNVYVMLPEFTTTKIHYTLNENDVLPRFNTNRMSMPCC